MGTRNAKEKINREFDAWYFMEVKYTLLNSRKSTQYIFFLCELNLLPRLYCSYNLCLWGEMSANLYITFWKYVCKLSQDSFMFCLSSFDRSVKKQKGIDKSQIMRDLETECCKPTNSLGIFLVFTKVRWHLWHNHSHRKDKQVIILIQYYIYLYVNAISSTFSTTGACTTVVHGAWGRMAKHVQCSLFFVYTLRVVAASFEDGIEGSDQNKHDK